METILRILPALACPIMMGLLMWAVMRNNGNSTADTAVQHTQSVRQPDRALSTGASPFRTVVGMIKCCLNPKVVAAFGLVGLGMWLFAPNMLAVALPVLLALVCPISMLLMMRSMGNRSNAHCAAGDEQAKQSHQSQMEVTP